MIRRDKGDRVIGPTVPAKMTRKESRADLDSAEVSLQQLTETDSKRQENLNVGLTDILFACCCGPLTKVRSSCCHLVIFCISPSVCVYVSTRCWLLAAIT